jgi:CspA family cold shock protein
MAIGRVKWFSNEKGYGFIEAVESKQDVFVHFSDIVMEGYKTLKENAMVFFVLEQGGKGPGARHVCPLNEAEAEGVHNGASDMPAPAAPIEVEHEAYDGVLYAEEADVADDGFKQQRRKARPPRQSATMA